MSYNMASSIFQKQRYTEKYTLAELKTESARIIGRFPDRVPVIVEKDPNSDIEDIDKNKYLVPKDLLWGQFITVIRKKIKLNPEKGLFIYAGNVMLNSTESTIGQVYEQHRDENGFLCVLYAGESVFGGL